MSEEIINRWEEKINYCITFSNGLNDWEAKFIDSIVIHFDTYNSLTFRQSKKLNQIFDKLQRKFEQ